MLAEPTTSVRDPFLIRLARGLLVALAFVLPFEAPLFRLGPLQITTVELVLYAMLAVSAVAFASDGIGHRAIVSKALAALRTDTMVQAAIVWAMVNFASALVAPSYRTAALKFALRTLSGVLAFFAVRFLTRRSDTDRVLILALLSGALLSATTAVVEWLVPASASLWEPFRPGHFTTFGLTRASGVFTYPTIGAMYWEAAVPLLVVAPFLGNRPRSERRAWGGAVSVVLASALLAGAILASATRSALVGAAVVAAAMAGLGRRSGVAIPRAATGALAVIALLSAIPLVTPGSGALLGQRLRWWHDDTWFRADYRVGTAPHAVSLGQVFSVPVTVTNTGTLGWTREGAHPFHLAYHWVEPDGSMSPEDFEGMRTELPADVPPGGVIEIAGQARAPTTAGTYRLRWDLLQDDVTWFSQRGNPMPELEVDVTAEATEVATDDEAQPAASSVNVASPDPSLPRRVLWRAAVTLWRKRPLLGVGPDNFRRRYGAVLASAPNGQSDADTSIHANSLYFETLADLGLAGVAALALIGWALVWRVRAHHLANGLSGLASGVAAGAFFVHGWFDYFLEFTPLFGLFWVLLGWTAAPTATQASAEALRGSTPSGQAP
jgi:hypothetical protein